MSFWTVEREKLLRKCMASSKSAAETAELIGDGCTRNMVIGKYNRLRKKRFACDDRRGSASVRLDFYVNRAARRARAQEALKAVSDEQFNTRQERDLAIKWALSNGASWSATAKAIGVCKTTIGNAVRRVAKSASSHKGAE